MEIGISLFGDLSVDANSGTVQRADLRLKDLLEEIKLADEVGLDIAGLGEHHREEYSIPAPEVILAAAATHTKNIKLTSAVSVLSSSDPVKLYQDFSLVDLLSQGRAEIIAGRGSFTESFPLFGYDLHHYHQLFKEKLDLLLKIKREKVINWQGKFRAELVGQQIYPKPTKPIDIWVASGGSTDSVFSTAQLGLPLILAVIAGTPLERFASLYNLYKETYAKFHQGTDEPRLGLFSHGLIGRNSREIKRYYYPIYAEQMDRIGRSRNWPPFQAAQYDFGVTPQGAMFVGEPQEVADKILYAKELYGITRFMLLLDVGAPSHKHIMESIELLGTKVAPVVREEYITANS